MTPALVGHVPFREAKQRFIKNYLAELCEATGWNVAAAARFAELERSNFRRMLKSAGVERPRRG